MAVTIAGATLAQLGFDPTIQPADNKAPLPVGVVPADDAVDRDDEQRRFRALSSLYTQKKWHACTNLPWNKLALHLRLRSFSDAGHDLPIPNSLTDPSSDPLESRLSGAQLPETTVFKIDDLIHQQAGVVGRGTTVFLTSEPSSLIIKKSWQPKTRPPEEEIIRHIRSRITPRWRKHITELRGSMTTDMEKDTISPRARLTRIASEHVTNWAKSTKKGQLSAHEIKDNNLRNTFVGLIEERILCTLVCVENRPLESVESLSDFICILRHVVKGKSISALSSLSSLDTLRLL